MPDERTWNVSVWDLELRPDKLLYEGLTGAGSIEEDWEVETGVWGATPRGVLGAIAEERAAILWNRRSFPRDLALSFRGRAVGKRGLDINCYWHGNGRLYGGEDPRCYIAVVGGWWDGKCGLEKFPEQTLTAATSFLSVPRKAWVEVVAGRYRDWLFLFVDGRKVLELHDPDPIDARANPRVALSTWNSEVEFSRFRVYGL